MVKQSSSGVGNKAAEPPSPEMLRPQSERSSLSSTISTAETASKMRARLYHSTYRPSHKATFIGLGVVVIILAVNVGVIFFLMKNNDNANNNVNKNEVTISSEVLDTLGVNRSASGSIGTELTVGPNSNFKGKVTIGGDVSVAGQLRLNSKFSATEASLTKLEAGETTLERLGVNGDATMTNLNLRKDLVVVGTTRLQGVVTATGLMTVNNSMNVSGNLSVGGLLSVRGFQASSLTSDTTLTIGGHIITRGSMPGLSRGSGLGAIDTISISGNDAAGTVAVNIGNTARSGILANVTFVNEYSNIPHVIVTAIGPGVEDLYVNRSSTGFSIGVGSISGYSGHAFDYVVMQ